MLTKVETYVCEYNSTPTKEDIEQALSFTKEHECVVEIVWTLKYAGTYKRMFTKDTTFDDAWESLPKVYGV